MPVMELNKCEAQAMSPKPKLAEAHFDQGQSPTSWQTGNCLQLVELASAKAVAVAAGARQHGVGGRSARGARPSARCGGATGGVPGGCGTVPECAARQDGLR